MERKDFLRSLGGGAAFALTFSCLHGCSSDSVADPEVRPTPVGVDFELDLNAEGATELSKNGGFILARSRPGLKYTDVVVARSLEGNFVAASQICSHEQTDLVRFVPDVDGGIFACSAHGSEFDQTGTPINNITKNPLKIFKTSLTGTILRVYE